MGFNSGFKGLKSSNFWRSDIQTCKFKVDQSRIERIKNEHIKEIMGLKENPDIIDIIERKRLQWYGHVKRMQDERLPKLTMEWIPAEIRKRGRPRKTWMEGVRAAMKTRHLEED